MEVAERLDCNRCCRAIVDLHAACTSCDWQLCPACVKATALELKPRQKKVACVACAIKKTKKRKDLPPWALRQQFPREVRQMLQGLGGA